MSENHLKLLKLGGSPYDIGYIHGKEGKEEIKKFLNVIVKHDFVPMRVVKRPSDKQKNEHELMSKMLEKTTNSISPCLLGKEILKRVCEEYRKL